MSTRLEMVGSHVVRDAAGTTLPEGVVVRALKVNRDPRGTLTELLRTDWPDLYGEEMPFAQVYTSTTGAGVARDEEQWHVHRHQTDRFYCVAGRITVAVADARPGSATHGSVTLVELAAEADAPAPLVVTIPSGTLHGFVVTSPGPATLLNFPNRLYDPSDEGRIPFAEAGVRWPDGTPFRYDDVRAWYDRAP